MKISKFIHCLSAAAVLLSARPISAQTQPALTCQLYAGIDLNGTTGSLYAIQGTDNLANSNGWMCLGLVQLVGTNCFWTDTSRTAASGQRFYRAVLTSTNMANILPGTFTMGSPTNEALRDADEVQHVVTITKGFYMGKYPVTQREYLAVAGSNPSHFTGNLDLPVEFVSWTAASNYCALRTAQEQAAGLLPANWVYRLPTESEWEYACRAGTVTAFYLGSSLHSQQANFAGTNEYDSAVGNIYNPSGVNLQQTTVVGSYAPNGWGLYDMTGNVLQWCQDWAGIYPTGNVIDPQGPSTGLGKEARGGSWGFSAFNCRSASRVGIKNGNQDIHTGFRVVLAQNR